MSLCFYIYIEKYSFYLLGRTYRKALQQMLKVTFTFSNTSICQSFVTSRCIVVLFGISLSGCALLNASQAAANNFDAKQYSRMNTCSPHECTMLTPAQLLHSWCEWWPSNKNDLDLNVMGEVGRVYYMGVDLLLILFLYCST
jgi:hypothetical protein